MAGFKATEQHAFISILCHKGRVTGWGHGLAEREEEGGSERRRKRERITCTSKGVCDLTNTCIQCEALAIIETACPSNMFLKDACL